MKLSHHFGNFVFCLGVTLFGVVLSGCETAQSGAAHAAAQASGFEVIRTGDPLVIVFSDTPTPMLPFEETVKDDGTITLLYNQTFVAGGRTRGDLERDIRSRYVPGYFNHLTVTVRTQGRFYFVDGEVKMPNKQEYSGEMTVLKAIATAQGFTDFANKKKVRLTRADGTTQIVNCDKALTNPALDVPVYAGDRIHVPRRLW